MFAPVVFPECLYHLLRSKWHYFIVVVIFFESFLTGMENTALHISSREAMGITRRACMRVDVLHVRYSSYIQNKPSNSAVVNVMTLQPLEWQ